MFNIHMLHADHGDCLWVEYGDPTAPKRILIDAGTPGTYTDSLLPKLEAVLAAEGKVVFELLVITHIDEDHIGGALRLLDQLDKKKVKIRQIWFNGYYNLSNLPHGILGPDQGERLTELIVRGGWKWNTSFGSLAVMVPDTGRLPTRTFSGMKLTLLSPTFEKLQKLKKEWETVISRAGLVPGKAYRKKERVLSGGFLGNTVEELAATKFSQDSKPANGSSIAFLAEYNGVRVLFGADAHPSVLIASARRAPLSGATVKLDAFKLPHHGSSKNVSIPMLEAFPAKHYLVSTDGGTFYHPDADAIARVVCVDARPKRLHFNCLSDYSREWADTTRQDRYNYKAKYGKDDEGLLVKL